MQRFQDYLKIEEVAQKWGISNRRVQALCAAGKIEGAIRFGRDWMIPPSTPRPKDGRTKAARSAAEQVANGELPFPRNTPFLFMSNLYSVPGSADQVSQEMVSHHEAQVLFHAEIAYSRGEIDRVYEHANYLLNKRSSFYAVLSAGMLLALCAIWHGDLQMWRRAKQHIAHAPAQSDKDRDIMAFSLIAVDSMLYDVEGFPDWFKIGCFEPLHRDSLPAAKVYYAKYLYATAYAVATKQYDLQGVQGLSLMRMLPYTIEPMIAQAMADDSIMAEMYLRMTCATIYHNIGDDSRAIHHIDRAISLALPDRLYGFLAEYCRVLESLLEQRLILVDKAVWEEVRQLYRIYNAGWSRLSGNVRGKNLITTLSRREREVAKLAAFGLQNAEIAEKLHMSLSGVKQAIRIVSEKTGASRDEFAAYL